MKFEYVKLVEYIISDIFNTHAQDFIYNPVTKKRLGFMMAVPTPFLRQYLIPFSIISVNIHKYTRRCCVGNSTSVTVCHFKL